VAVQRSTTRRPRIAPGLVVLSRQLAVGRLGMVLRFQAQDPVVMAALGQVVKIFDSTEGAAWKMVLDSPEELSGSQEYLKILGLVAKVLDPSRTSREDRIEHM
jgi:hypothetical protein